jgi:hypothetical protein
MPPASGIPAFSPAFRHSSGFRPFLRHFLRHFTDPPSAGRGQAAEADVRVSRRHGVQHSSPRVIIERGQVLDKVVMVTGFRIFAKVLPMAFGEAATTKHQTNKHHDPHVACTSTGGHGIQHNSCGLVSA